MNGIIINKSNVKIVKQLYLCVKNNKMKYKRYSLRNSELTTKALNYIDRYGRNTFENKIQKLLNKKECLIKHGWIKKGKKK